MFVQKPDVSKIRNSVDKLSVYSNFGCKAAWLRFSVDARREWVRPSRGVPGLTESWIRLGL